MTCKEVYKSDCLPHKDDAKKSDIFNTFEVQKPFECTVDGLFLYRTKFMESACQLATVKLRNKGECIDYTKYYRHHDAVIRVFTDNLIGTERFLNRKLADFEQVEYTEAVYMKMCNNGGLVYFDKQYADKTIQSYGYDFKSFYPSILSKSINIPLKRGKEVTLTKLPFDANQNVQMGFYHAKVEYVDPEFRKLFCTSANDIYTNYSLDTALKYVNNPKRDKKYDSNRRDFGVTVRLYNHENNAYIYDPSDCINSSQYFKYWHETLAKLKKECPDNVLIKSLFSSLWGHLCEYNLVNAYDKDMNSINCGDIEDSTAEYYNLTDRERNDEKREFKVSPKDQIFKNGIARMMPFLTSFGRARMEQMAIYPNLDKVVRVYTDGVVFSSHDIVLPKSDLFVPEAKTTGLILWKNSQNYTKIV